MKRKYKRAIRTLERVAKKDESIKQVIDEIKESYDEENVNDALALTAILLLNYKDNFTVEDVKRDFTDLKLEELDIVHILEMIEEKLENGERVRDMFKKKYDEK